MAQPRCEFLGEAVKATPEELQSTRNTRHVARDMVEEAKRRSGVPSSTAIIPKAVIINK
jgi:hypothetical protein